LQLDSLQQQREIESLKEQIKQGAETLPAASPEVQIDTGGPTGIEGEEQVQNAVDLRQQAEDLKAQGRYTEAQWVAIRAAQEDPTKILRVKPGESQ
jgi:hypothetical protein